MKRYLSIAGIILLVGVVLLYEEKHEVETDDTRIVSPELTYARMEMPQLATNGSFLDHINISYDPMMNLHDSEPQRASLALEKDPPPASLGRLQPRLVETRDPLLTVVDRQLNFELFGAEGFTLKLNLKPAYPNPTALIPTRLDPGIGVSIKF
ncbi:MAG: hypothetical protein WAO02_11170 [Verrucomicrobiia bacterium]